MRDRGHAEERKYQEDYGIPSSEAFLKPRSITGGPVNPFILKGTMGQILTLTVKNWES